MSSIIQKKKVEIKVEDGEIDLSMLALQEVPSIKDIAKKKAHTLDLSNNQITSLPKSFPTLTQLVKIDLSKNLLTELPESFGDLVRLKRLDLYKNNLETLPLSFSKLKALKWLDLKDNPLVPTIAGAAGPCLDDQQCHLCAKNIIHLYTQLQNQFDKVLLQRQQQRQKDLQTNLQKQKKQKIKNKKAKKSKISKENNSTLINNSVAKNHKQRNENKAITSTQTNTRWFNILKNSVLLLFLLSIMLFALTAAQLSYFKNIELQVVELWNHYIQTLPLNLQDYGLQAGEAIRIIHVRTGEVIYLLTGYIYKLKTSESLNVIVSEAGQVLKNVTQTATRFYLKMFGE